MKYFRWILRTIQAIGILIRNPRKLYFVLHADEQYQKSVRRKFPVFSNGLPEINLSELFPDFDGQLHQYSFLGGTSEPTDLLLLKNLAIGIKNCRYFEIGTWRGESILAVSDHVSACHTLNLSAVQLKNLGYSSEEIAAQGFYLQKIPNLTQHHEDSRHFDFRIPGKFDLVFIDGDHHFEVVSQDTKKVFQHLLHENSIVVWHDYTQHFSTIWWEVFSGILDGLPSEKFRQLFHVRNTNCAVYLPHHKSVRSSANPWIPEQNFSVNIHLTHE